MLAVKINDSHTEEYLAQMARKQGKSRQAIVREILKKQIEDAEDYQAAVKAKRNIESGNSKTISLDEMWGRLGLGD